VNNNSISIDYIIFEVYVHKSVYLTPIRISRNCF